MLEVHDIHFAYGEKKILNGVSFDVQKGEIVALIGVSGSGKTTLFRLITGLLHPDKGAIFVQKSRLPKAAFFTTYMRQDALLLPWRTVLGNLLLFSELGLKTQNNKDLTEKALFLLARLGLKGYETAYPDELSGGMRQRVALARALLQERPLFLLDEPFASLDVIIREQLYVLLREICVQFEKTMVLVTHDFRDALALADRILILSHGKISAEFKGEKNNNALIVKIREHLLDQATF